jgi:hypothetical protein
MDPTAIIHRSLTVFVCGMIGLLPVIGFVPALMAIIEWSRARKYPDWNPAAAYLKWGGRMALIGIAHSALAVLVVGLAVINSLI